MKYIFTILVFVFIIIGSIYLIGNFFDIQPEHYVPYIFWVIGLGIFFLILDSNNTNLFMKNI